MTMKKGIGEFKLMFSHHLICSRLVDNLNKTSLVIKQDILKLNCPFTFNATTTGVQLLMEQWKQALVALHAAGLGVICSRLGSVGSLCMR